MSEWRSRGSSCSGSCGHLGPPLKTPFLSQIDLYAGALFVHICLGWNFYISTILMLIITALYTIAGTVPGQGWVEVLGRGGLTMGWVLVQLGGHVLESDRLGV